MTRATNENKEFKINLNGFLNEEQEVANKEIKHEEYFGTNGSSIDLIMQLKDDNWAAIEICLGGNQVKKAASKLKHFVKQIEKNKPQIKKPEFLLIITAENFSYKYDDNIFVIPHACLKN